MLHDDSAGNPHGLEEEDKNVLFNRTWLSLVKTSAMFVGELEFSDIPINSETYFGMLAYAFFLTFVFLIVVVLMNLLNGLAVNDTSDIKQKAEIYSYISRVETISYMESVLLGDPFNFLSNVPSYLSSLPSCSMLRQVYRSGLCSRLLGQAGAARFLLFYTFLPDKQLSVRPNVGGSCCAALAGDQLGRDIVAAAKSVIVESRAASQQEEDVPRLKQEIADLHVQLSQFSQVIKKIDILMARK